MRALAREPLRLRKTVTFLVGENGSGKSTLVEAIAEAFGWTPGGRAGRKYGNQREKPLGQVMRLGSPRGARMRTGPRTKRKGYFLRAETRSGSRRRSMAFPATGRKTSVNSHGEGFLVIFRDMFREPGLYLMDEPEAALSFSSCLQLVTLMHELGRSGAQVICAPTPRARRDAGADIVEWATPASAAWPGRS